MPETQIKAIRFKTTADGYICLQNGHVEVFKVSRCWCMLSTGASSHVQSELIRVPAFGSPDRELRG